MNETPVPQIAIEELQDWLEKRATDNGVPVPSAEPIEPVAPVRGRRDIDAHPLMVVFTKAVEQAMYGKGERHGGAVTPFLDQPWLKLANVHGNGFLTGQAVKKLEEAVKGKDGEAWDREVLGAVVYLGMAYIHKGQLVNPNKEE